jgi:hypothetical protein
LDAALTAYAAGAITLDELTMPLSSNVAGAAGATRFAAVVRLVAYLNAARYYDMEDSGAWEELPRRNTSSIGIVVSALEKLNALLALGGAGGAGRLKTGSALSFDPGRATAFAQEYTKAATALGMRDSAGSDAVADLIAKGYETVHRQLRLGGESPDCDKTDPRYREADAALLSLIYPANPRELGADEKLKILDIVGTLAGDYGIRRYERDNYQAGNFWWHDIRTDADPESHRKRKESFIEGTEAEWFFDSWYAKCCLMVAKEIEAAGDGAEKEAAVPRGTSETGANNRTAADPAALRRKAVKHLNRAFGQITGEGMYSADGKPVPAEVPPESYNHIVAEESRADGSGEAREQRGKRKSWPAPSPIAPLNWAKASLTLALSEFLGG